MKGRTALDIANGFFRALQVRDPERMVAFYHAGAIFSDPVFRVLNAKEVMTMWKMLCQKSDDLRVEYRVIQSHESAVVVEWDAFYTFTRTGRRVHNHITTKMIVSDGEIISQRDEFDFWKWSSQAFGLKGWLLGWNPLFGRLVYRSAMESLRKFN